MRFNLNKRVVLAFSLLMGLMANAQQLTGEDAPQRWMYTESFDQTLPTDDNWWKSFGDPMLDSLITKGMDNNYNVLMALRRIEIARQQLRQARSAYFPQLQVNGGWTKARNSGMTGPVASKATEMSYFDIGAQMSWEIDVFGKITARAKEGKANYQASRAEYAGTMVSMSASIASSYFQLRCIQAEIALLNRHISSQKRIVEITQARHEAGLASALDVSQASTTYYSTLASITSLKSSETSAINSLAVLLGVFPADIDSMLREPEALPDYHQIVAVGVPMELLRRRPDIVAAEYELAGYAAALGVAKRDFLPTLSLTGSIGTSAHDGSDLFTRQSYSYTIAPTLSWTVFDGLSRQAAAAQAKEQMMAGIDNYNLTLITAVEEVETAMSNYANDLQYIDYLEQVEAEARKSLNLSVDLYKQGLTAFINVTDSQINLLQYSTQLVLAKGQAITDLVSLYKALGGGWDANSITK